MYKNLNTVHCVSILVQSYLCIPVFNMFPSYHSSMFIPLLPSFHVHQFLRSFSCYSLFLYSRPSNTPVHSLFVSCIFVWKPIHACFLHSLCVYIQCFSFLPSLIHSVIPSFLHSILPWFLNSLFHSFLISFILYFFPSFLISFLPSCLPYTIHSSLHSCLHSFLLSFIQYIHSNIVYSVF